MADEINYLAIEWMTAKLNVAVVPVTILII